MTDRSSGDDNDIIGDLRSDEYGPYIVIEQMSGRPGLPDWSDTFRCMRLDDGVDNIWYRDVIMGDELLSKGAS